MPDGHEPVTVKVIQRIAEVAAAEWNACAGDDNPTVSHAFLHALEESQSVCADTGWLPQHLVVEDDAGHLVGAAPLYLKSHSYGEYVFDHGWAHAFERAGGDYYPKLQCAVPFTPVTGPRLLVRPGSGAERIQQALIQALQRTGRQFHWTNDGYESFDDFLAGLNSRKRKAVRKERRQVAESGVTLHTLTGDDIEPRHWLAFHRFYLNTVDRKWGGAYLTRDLFLRLGESMADRVVLVVAEKDDRLVAGAFNLLGNHAIYGRNWGCDGHYKFLHFEACYYRAIDFAIEHGLKYVEAGAQGPHKIQRGYLPVPTYSAHWIANTAFRRAVADFLEHEHAEIEYEIREYAEYSPFRKEGE
jgi:predicted N-acyltransferase